MPNTAVRSAIDATTELAGPYAFTGRIDVDGEPVAVTGTLTATRAGDATMEALPHRASRDQLLRALMTRRPHRDQ